LSETVEVVVVIEPIAVVVVVNVIRVFGLVVNERALNSIFTTLK
jgi:hypothetical protein